MNLGEINLKKKLWNLLLVVAFAVGFLGFSSRANADWQGSLEVAFPSAQKIVTFDNYADWKTNGVATSSQTAEAYESTYLPKFSDGTMLADWGYWNVNRYAFKYTPTGGTFSAGDIVTSLSGSDTCYAVRTVDGDNYLQFVGTWNGQTVSSPFQIGETISNGNGATGIVEEYPKFIGNFGDYTWQGSGKSLCMDLGDNDDTNYDQMAGFGAQRLGTYFGDGTDTSGLSKPYIFMMLRYKPNYWDGTMDNLTYISVLKHIVIDAGFTDIQTWGTEQQRIEFPTWAAEYGPTYSLFNLVGGGLSNPNKIYFQEEYRHLTPGTPPYLIDYSHAEFLSTTRVDGYMADSGGETKWYGMEIAVDAGTTDASDGTTDIWLYDSDGTLAYHQQLTGLNHQNVYDQKYNKITLGGNRRSGNTLSFDLDGRYYVDDFIVNNSQIGPTYFSTLSSFSASADLTPPSAPSGLSVN